MPSYFFLDDFEEHEQFGYDKIIIEHRNVYVDSDRLDKLLRSNESEGMVYFQYKTEYKTEYKTTNKIEISIRLPILLQTWEIVIIRKIVLPIDLRLTLLTKQKKP